MAPTKKRCENRPKQIKQSTQHSNKHTEYFLNKQKQARQTFKLLFTRESEIVDKKHFTVHNRHTDYKPGTSKHAVLHKKSNKCNDYQVDTSEMPPELQGDHNMIKYWRKRYSYFRRFDQGIKLDRESWFSVTPELVAHHTASECACDVMLDAFCGAGGNTIQFAMTCKKVIAIDIDPAKIAMARHNAAVYGVAERITFVEGDFFQLAPTLRADMVFLSPPWGGPTYSENQVYDIETMLKPKPASELMRVARNISPKVVLYLPRDSRLDQIQSLAKEVNGIVEYEKNYLERKFANGHISKSFVAVTAYYTPDDSKGPGV